MKGIIIALIVGTGILYVLTTSKTLNYLLKPIYRRNR